MNKNENKMPKWKDMMPYEKVLTVLSYIVVAIYLVSLIYYKFKVTNNIFSLMIGAVLLLSGGICIRTKKKLAYIWFGLGLLEILFVVINIFM